MQNGKPKFLIHVKEEGILGETSCSSDLDSREAMLQIQDKWAAQTKKEISVAIKAAQQAESEWKKLSKDWPRIFAQSEYEVQVEAYIQRTGMRGTSFKKQMKEEEG